MDVGNPSNFVRVLELFDNDFKQIQNKISSFRISDEITKKTISEVYENHNYLLDPHGAVAYTALDLYLKENPTEKGIILETAHTLKFNNVVEPIIGEEIEIHLNVKTLLEKTKNSILISPTFQCLSNELLKWV